MLSFYKQQCTQFDLNYSAYTWLSNWLLCMFIWTICGVKQINVHVYVYLCVRFIPSSVLISFIQVTVLYMTTTCYISLYTYLSHTHTHNWQRYIDFLFHYGFFGSDCDLALIVTNLPVFHFTVSQLRKWLLSWNMLCGLI